MLLTTGCRSLRPSDGEGIFAYRDVLSTDTIRGPLERAFQGEQNVLERGEKFSPKALSQLDRARTCDVDLPIRANSTCNDIAHGVAVGVFLGQVAGFDHFLHQTMVGRELAGFIPSY